jgi:hypothetical protein
VCGVWCVVCVCVCDQGSPRTVQPGSDIIYGNLNLDIKKGPEILC